MNKYKHKKLGRIAEKYNKDNYITIMDKGGMCIIKELIENSEDREPIQEKERTRDGLWIGSYFLTVPDLGEDNYYKTGVEFGFKTEEHANSYDKKKSARYKIKKRQELNDDFEPDWNNIDQRKHYTTYWHSDQRLYTFIDGDFQHAEFYFSSEKKAQQFIDECGQHFLDYYNIK